MTEPGAQVDRESSGEATPADFRKTIRRVMYEKSTEVPGLAGVWSDEVEGLHLSVAVNSPELAQRMGYHEEYKVYPKIDTPNRVQPVSITSYRRELDGKMWREVRTFPGGVDHSGLIPLIEVAEAAIVATARSNNPDADIPDHPHFEIERKELSPEETFESISRLRTWAGLGPLR